MSAKKLAYLQNLHEQAICFDEASECKHSHKEIRKRMVRKQGIQYAYQCLDCGVLCSTPVAKAVALSGGGEPPLYQEDAYDKWLKLQRKERQKVFAGYCSIEQIQNAIIQVQYQNRHREYIRSDQWREIAHLVMKRASGMCEGCLTKEAEQVHHLTYDHFGDELFYELVALCGDCHMKAHAQ